MKDAEKDVENTGVTVECILVNYKSPWEMLERCLRSLRDASGEAPLKVTLIDNASGDGVIERARSDFPDVRIVEMGRNAGFAAAVNRGLDTVAGPMVLLLNTDAVLTPGALGTMVSALEAADSNCAGVAPKMMSSAHEGVIDAIGTVMPPNGAGFNRGIGQCDLGQYDSPEEVAGVCFGAALLRRKLFEPDGVGRLYEGYFLYFEDSDWCHRAAACGYSFLTAPEAVVLHLHSGVTRNESLAFKYKLIELNTLRLVVRNFESPLRAARVVGARSARLIARTLIRRKFIGANLATLAQFARELPRLLEERKRLGRKRTVSDAGIFQLAEGEDAFFDTVDYRPDRCLDSLIATYVRLLQREKNPAHGKILAALYRLSQEQVSGRAPLLDPKTAELFASECECVRALLDSATVS